ncbi:hypothetical protein [Streptomyces sp. NPDC052535]|uniref:hypothetical protein n=1 Tax=Streptomyces sp. NPDC052535 TaxID=3155531 RepID=UPI00342F344D
MGCRESTLEGLDTAACKSKHGGRPPGTPRRAGGESVEQIQPDLDPVKRLHKFRNRIAHHEGIWHLPLEARRDDIQTVLGFTAPAAATWVADASRIDDVLARRP